MSTSDTYATVRACALAMMAGAILHAGDVTAGNGTIVDWREVKSGEELQSGADAFDTAQLFVTLVGPELALGSVRQDIGPAPDLAPAAPVVVAFMVDPSSGGRRRMFDVGPFRVYVEPSEDDGAQADFTARLAAMALELTRA